MKKCLVTVGVVYLYTLHQCTCQWLYLSGYVAKGWDVVEVDFSQSYSTRVIVAGSKIYV